MPTGFILDSVDSQIRAALHEYFGRPVEVDDRVLESLSFRPRSGPSGRKRSHTHQQVWKALLTTLPVIWKVYGAIGYRPESGPNPFPQAKMERLTSETLGADPLDWQHSFRKLFEIGPAGQPGERTNAAKSVASTGHLRATYLAKSLLESGVVPRNRGPRPNGVTRRLAEGSGFVPDARELVHVAPFIALMGILLDGFAALDAELGDQQFVVYHDGSRYRLAPSAAFGSNALVAPTKSQPQRWPVAGRVIQPPTYFSADATAELEELMNENAKEADFQRFFESHPEFLLALGPWKEAHPHLVLHHDSGRLIPDFFVERMDSQFCDVIDLKRPDTKLSRGVRRPAVTAAVMEAVAQLEEYRSWFESPTNRAAFQDDHGLGAFRPRVVVIIGRTAAFGDPVARGTFENQLPSWLEVRTYDEILDQAQRWRHYIGA